MTGLKSRGVLAALTAAMLFGASTPAAKALLGAVDPLLMAGILYLGSGVGLAFYCALRPGNAAPVPPAQIKWLAAAILLGGMMAPALLMWGLARMAAAEVSLLLNLESVLTALLAWFLFREHFDRRVAIGMALIVAGAVTLAVPGRMSMAGPLPALAVAGACLAWALDNNRTRRASLGDAATIAMWKGLVAGTANAGLALASGSAWPALDVALPAALIGLVGYGVSLALFVFALRELGTARAGAYFSTAPFAGALVAVGVLGEPLTPGVLAAGALMAIGVWLHLTERHEHPHAHEETVHEHEHAHDAHHQHDHSEPVAPGTRHSHAHRHEPMTHSHPHYPDEHHRHGHERRETKDERR